LSEDMTFVEKMNTVWLIVVDPPREWLHPDVCTFLNNLRQDYAFQLIYISCNPVTLARDLDLLVQGGRWLETLQPVDMFPHTHHVEMISVLT
jgi:23S rRNA (uracil1939-C5)-methyltransferase